MRAAAPPPQKRQEMRRILMMLHPHKRQNISVIWKQLK